MLKTTSFYPKSHFTKITKFHNKSSKKMNRRKIISWSNLPSELLLPIANRLETRQDILNSRAVCKHWHRSISISLISGKNVLSFILPHKIKSNNSHFNSLVLSASSIFLVNPIEDSNAKLPPWLVTVDEVNQGNLTLRKPFSRFVVEEMPFNCKVLGLDKFDVKEMGRVYSLWCKWDRYELFEEEHKVVLLGESMSIIDDCIAVVLYDYGKLAVINLRDGNVEVVSYKGLKFDDIVVFNGVVYVIDRRGRLYLMDRSGDRFKLLNIVQDSLKPGSERKSRLVESCGKLYFVRKCSVSRPSLQKKCPGFRVYKLNQEKNTWDELDSIGNDRILFVTPDRCFFGRTSDFCGWEGNCIVFRSTDSFPSYVCVSSDSDDGSYKYMFKKMREDRLCIELFHFEDCKFSTVEYKQRYCAVFWPPPRWISPYAYSSDDESMMWTKLTY